MGEENDLKSILKTMPKKIKEQEEELLECSFKKEELELKNKKIKQELLNVIAGIVSLTNELQRKAELEKRLDRHSEFASNDNTLKKLDKKLKEGEIELAYLKRLNTNANSLALIGVK